MNNGIFKRFIQYKELLVSVLLLYWQNQILLFVYILLFSVPYLGKS